MKSKGNFVENELWGQGVMRERNKRWLSDFIGQVIKKIKVEGKQEEKV